MDPKLNSGLKCMPNTQKLNCIENGGNKNFQQECECECGSSTETTTEYFCHIISHCYPTVRL